MSGIHRDVARGSGASTPSDYSCEDTSEESAASSSTLSPTSFHEEVLFTSVSPKKMGRSEALLKEVFTLSQDSMSDGYAALVDEVMESSELDTPIMSIGDPEETLSSLRRMESGKTKLFHLEFGETKEDAKDRPNFVEKIPGLKSVRDQMKAQVMSLIQTATGGSSPIGELTTALRSTLTQNMTERLAPALFQSLFADASLGEKIALAPLELLRLGIVEDCKMLDEWIEGLPLFEYLQGDFSISAEMIDQKIDELINGTIERNFCSLRPLLYALPPMFRMLFESYLPSGQKKNTAALLEFTRTGEGWFLDVTQAGAMMRYVICEEELTSDFFRYMQGCPKGESGTVEEFISGPLSLFQLCGENAQVSQDKGVYAHYISEMHHLNDAQYDLLQYRLKKKVYLEMWAHLLHSPKDLPKLHRQMKIAIDQLVDLALSLSKKKLLSDVELEALYALNEKVLAKLDRAGALKRDALPIPGWVASSLSSVFGSVSKENATWLKYLIVGACGHESGRVVDEYLNLVGLNDAPAEAETISFATSVKDEVSKYLYRVFSPILNFPFDAFKRPSLIGVLRIAFAVTEIAMMVLFPAETLALLVGFDLTRVAAGIIYSSFQRIAPEAHLWIEKQKARLIGCGIAKFYAMLILNNDNFQEFTEIISYFSELGARKAPIDLSKIASLQGRDVVDVTVEEDLEADLPHEEVDDGAGVEFRPKERQEVEQSAFSSASDIVGYDGVAAFRVTGERPLEVFEQGMTSAELKKRLYSFADEIAEVRKRCPMLDDFLHANLLDSSIYEDPLKLCYRFHQYVCTLPPLDDEIWSGFEPQELLDLVHHVANMYSKVNLLRDSDNRIMGVTQSEVFLNIYFLYALADKNARMIEQAHLQEDHLPNAAPLAMLKDAWQFTVSPGMRSRLDEVLGYFHIEKERRYSNEERKELDKASMFSEFTNPKVTSMLGYVTTTLPKYYNDLYDKVFAADPKRKSSKAQILLDLYDGKKLLPQSFKKLREVHGFAMHVCMRFNSHANGREVRDHHFDTQGMVTSSEERYRETRSLEYSMMGGTVVVDFDEKSGKEMYNPHKVFTRKRVGVAKSVNERFAGGLATKSLLASHLRDRISRVVAHLLDDVFLIDLHNDPTEDEEEKKDKRDAIRIFTRVITQSDWVARLTEDSPESIELLREVFDRALTHVNEHGRIAQELALINAGIIAEHQTGEQLHDFSVRLIVFCRVCQEKILDSGISHFKHLLKEALRLLALYYFLNPPEKMSGMALYHGFEALLLYPSDEMTPECVMMKKMWKEALATRFDENKARRDILLSKYYYRSQKEKEFHEWQGKYPHYRCGDIELTVGKIDRDFPMDAIQEAIETRIANVLSEGGRVKPEKSKNITIRPNAIRKVPIAYYARVNDLPTGLGIQYCHYCLGKRYELIDYQRPGDPPYTSYWRRDNEISVLRDGVYVESIKIKESQPNRFQKNVAAPPPVEDEVRLVSFDDPCEWKALPQLTWFVSPSKIEFLRENRGDFPLRKISIPSYDIEFSVESVDGEQRAYCTQAPGYFIAKCQDPQMYPELNGIPRFLVLENGEGKRKVLLPEGSALSDIATVTDFVTLPDALRGIALPYVSDSIGEGKTGVHLCTLSKSEGIVADTPESVMLMITEAIHREDYQETKRWLDTLSRMAKREPLPNGVLEKIGMLELAGIASNRPTILAIVYRLIAIREESLSVHGKKDCRNHLLENVPGMAMIEFASMAHYFARGSGKDPYTDLFVARQIVARARALIREHSDKLPIPKPMLQVGGEAMTFCMLAFLVDRKVLDRYYELIAKYGSEKERMECDAARLIPRITLGKGDGAAPGMELLGRMSEVARDLIATPKKMLAEGKSYHFDLEGVVEKEWSDDIPLQPHAITPESFVKNFLLYYRLATRQEKEGMPEGEAFDAARKKLGHALAFLEGKASFRKEKGKIKALRAILASDDVEKFPPAASYNKMGYWALNVMRAIVTEKVSVWDVAKNLGKMAVGAAGGALLMKAQLGVTALGYLRRVEIPKMGRGEPFIRKPYRADSACDIDAMQEVDRDLALQIQDLVDEHFEEFEQGEIEQVEPFEKDDPAFEHLNESLDEYQGQEREIGYRLKDQEMFVAAAKELQQKVTEKTSDLREEILAHIERKRLEARASIPLDERLKGQQKRDASRAELLLSDPFADALAQFGQMEVEDQDLEELIYKYLLHATRLKQLERGIEGKKGSELRGDRRVYRLDEMPEHLARVFLLLEYGFGSMLWKNQVEQHLLLLTTDKERQVNQQPTGSGKTAVGIPVVGAYGSRDGRCVYNFFHAPLAQGQIAETSERSAAAFHREGTHFTVSRENPPTAMQLDAWITLIKRATEKGETLSGVKLDLQTLELLFVEEISSKNGDDALIDRYRELFRLVREKVWGNVDEAHLLFKRNKELNHPLGVALEIVDREKVIVLEAAAVLADHLDVEDDYLETKPLLAEHFCNFFRIAHENRDEFVDYLQDIHREVPPFVLGHPRKSEIALARGLIARIIPETCTPQRIGNDKRRPRPMVDFGLSKAHPEQEFAKPYNGNSSPIEGSRIKNVYEATMKTAILYLKTGLSNEQVRKLIAKMMTLAEDEAESNEIPIEKTRPYELLKEWSGAKSLRNHKFTAAELAKIGKMRGAILSYVHHLIPIESYPLSVQSTSPNFASMFRGFYSMTASPDPIGTLPTGTEVLWYPGTAGAFVNFICTKCRKVEEVAIASGKKTLDTVLERYFSHEGTSRALIDGGAFFEGMSNLDVAKAIAKYCKTHRPDIRGVVFFEGEVEMILLDGRVMPLSQSQIPLENRFVYFDDAHTTGADVKQADDAHAIVTVAEKTNLQQAVGRMRRKEHGQTVTLVKREGQLGASNDPRELIKRIALSDWNASRRENYLSALDQVRDVHRRHILDRILYAADACEAREIAEENRSVLIHDKRPDPFALYGGAQEEVTCLEAIEREKAKIADPDVRARVLPGGINPAFPMPESVTLAPHDDLGVEQEIIATAEQVVEVAQEAQQQVHQQVDIDQDQMVDMSAMQEQKLCEFHAKWEECDYFNDLSWLTPSSSERYPSISKMILYSVKDVMANDRSTSGIDEFFDHEMLWSSNAIGMCGNFSVALTPMANKIRKPIFHVLVVESRLGIRTIGIDQEEADEWRDRLEKSSGGSIKIALFDLSTQTVAKNGPDPIDFETLPFSFWVQIGKWQFVSGHPRIVSPLDPNSERSQEVLKALDAAIPRGKKREMYTLFHIFCHAMHPHLSIRADEWRARVEAAANKKSLVKCGIDSIISAIVGSATLAEEVGHHPGEASSSDAFDEMDYYEGRNVVPLFHQNDTDVPPPARRYGPGTFPHLLSQATQTGSQFV